MEKTILDYVQLVKRKLWLIVMFVLISCGTTYYVSQKFVEPVYSASGQLLVNSSAGVPEASQLNNQYFSLNLIESYKEIMMSPTIMKRVVAEHPEFGLTADELAEKVVIRTSDTSQVINLSVEDPSYQQAAVIINSVAQTFIRSLPELMQLNNVTFLTPADPADVPEPSTGLVMNLAISFVVSLVAALGIILLQETLNGTLRTEKEAMQAIGLPVIAAIPPIRKRDFGKSQTAKSRVGEGAYAATE